MDKLNIHCCIPDYKAFVSGGNVYNEALFNADAIDQVSFHFDLTQLIPFQKEDLVFVDTLFMESFFKSALKGASKSILIVHHLESLHPAAGFDLAKEKTLLNSFDGFLVSSSFTKSYLIEKGFQKEIIHVIQPISSITFSEQGMNIKRPLRVMLVANLIERKGLIEFFEALEIIYKSLNEIPEIEFNIIGGEHLDLEYAIRLKTFITKSLLNDQVHFLGEVSPDGMDDLYKQHHLLISVAKMETFGMAIQEAALAGLVVLALERGAVKDHIDNKSMLGFDNLQKLIQDLLDLAENESKLEKRLEMAHSKAMQFPKRTWEAEYQKMITFFEN